MVPQLARVFWRFLRQGSHPWEEEDAKYKGRFGHICSSLDPNRGTSLSKAELYTLFSSVLAVAELEGALAELGVYRGNSARLICEVKGDKPLYLFDTFSGMPEERISPDKDTWAKATHTDTSVEDVRAYLSQYPAVRYVPGVFPGSVSGYADEPIDRLTFCFAHLDVDLYQSTLDGLAFFYPRLVPGGRIVSHNYNLKKSRGVQTPGVKTAFREYFKGKEHQIIEIAETQCMVIKE